MAAGAILLYYIPAVDENDTVLEMRVIKPDYWRAQAVILLASLMLNRLVPKTFDLIIVAPLQEILWPNWPTGLLIPLF